MSTFRTGGHNGCVGVFNTAEKTGKFYGFTVNADAVVSAMTITLHNGTTTDGVTLMNVSGATLKQGLYFPVAHGTYISSITLASGSIVLYNI